MNIIYFVDSQYVKKNTAIEGNVEDNLINNYILKSQDTHIQQVLGSGYYNYIKTNIVSGSLPTQEDNLLRQYIQPALAEWTFYEIIPHLNYKSTNKAISQQNSEFSNPSALDEVKYLRNSVRDMAEFYTKRLTKELCTGRYSRYGSFSDENLTKNTKSYFSGIYLNKNKYTYE